MFRDLHTTDYVYKTMLDASFILQICSNDFTIYMYDQNSYAVFYVRTASMSNVTKYFQLKQTECSINFKIAFSFICH